MKRYRCFNYFLGILAKVRESAENMQHKIQSRNDGLNAKYSERGNTFFLSSNVLNLFYLCMCPVLVFLIYPRRLFFVLKKKGADEQGNKHL